jgi:small-conductance mechanosensitive channel
VTETIALSRQPSWLVVAVLVGVVYGAVGVLLAIPSNHVQVWRLAAWIISAAIYFLHIGTEHFKLRNSFLASSFHVAAAVAIGGFALAVAALVHSFFVVLPYPRARLYLALVLWPILTGIPSFLVALMVTGLLAWLTPRRETLS